MATAAGVLDLIDDMNTRRTEERLRDEGRREILLALLRGELSVKHPYTGEMCKITATGAPEWQGECIPPEDVLL